VEAEVIEVCRPDRPDHPLLRPHVVVLRERNGTRRLPTYTGSAEAIALACCLDAGEMPGPRIYRVDAAILDDPVVDSHPEWEQYPARLADLAAEERQRRADSQARLREHESPPGSEPTALSPLSELGDA